MTFTIELSDRQAATLAELLPLCKTRDGKPVTEAEFCKAAVVQAIIQAKQKLVASELQ